MTHLNQEQIDKLIRNYTGHITTLKFSCGESAYDHEKKISDKQKKISIIKDSEDFISLFEDIEKSIVAKLDDQDVNNLNIQQLLRFKNEIFNLIHDILILDWDNEEIHVLRMFLSKNIIIKEILKVMIRKDITTKEEYILLLKNHYFVKNGGD